MSESEKHSSLCDQVRENIADIIDVVDGAASETLYDHIAECDACRDFRHEAERARDLVAQAGADFEPGDLEKRARDIASKDEAKTDSSEDAAAKQSDEKAEPPAPVIPKKTVPAVSARRDPSGKPPLGLALGVAAAIGLVVFLTSRSKHDFVKNAPAQTWRGEVVTLSRAAKDGAGLELCAPDGSACASISEGKTLGAGSVLRTDDRSRATVRLDDSTVLSLDRSTEIAFDGGAPRRARVEHGRAVVDVPRAGSDARLDVPQGRVDLAEGKLSVRVEDDGTVVVVSRGEARVADGSGRMVEVRAGEEGRLFGGSEPDVVPTPSQEIASAIAWSEADVDRDDDVSAPGLGRLTAKKPGEAEERKGAVGLASHSVKVRIAGSVARTEVEEVFENRSEDVLEGIYRFPLPPDSQIERLALDVDGKMEEGAFVDRERAAAIWRGAIVNANAKERQHIQDEIVWVPGPWRDPALLEWKRGGSFELRIYPIPKHGSRRIRIAYTQVVQPVGGARRYVYPLPHDPSGSTRIGRFDVDLRVTGAERSFGVRSHGYRLEGDMESGLRFGAADFVPAGDLAVEYALPDRTAEVTAWAYQPTSDEMGDRSKRLERAKNPSDSAVAFPGSRPVGTVPGGTGFSTGDGADPYVAIALRPVLPRANDARRLTFAVIVDTSRSMLGERYRRATSLAKKIVREIDARDDVVVLACDSTCRAMDGGALVPGAEAAADVDRFLSSITPEGASDLAGAVKAARSSSVAREGRALRVVYIGDGTPTVGPVEPAFVRREIERTLPAGAGSVTAVAIGADADLPSLRALASSGGGVVVPYTPGQSVAEAAYATLGSAYGAALRDVDLVLPDGFVEVAPARVATIPAGGETIVVARMTRPSVDGTIELRGRVGNVAFERRYPIRVEASSAQGNAFVPRLFAAARIAELETDPSPEAKQKAIALSTSFDVASRYTSLLVLESEAMVRAFGLDTKRSMPDWSGEDVAEGSTAKTDTLALSEKSKDEAPTDAEIDDAYAADDKMDNRDEGGGGPLMDRLGGVGGPSGSTRSASGSGFGYGSGDEAKKSKGGGWASPPPSPVSPPRAAAEAPMKPRAKAAFGCAPGDALCQARAMDRQDGIRDEPQAIATSAPDPEPPPMRRMVPMRRVWKRAGSITPTSGFPASANDLALDKARNAYDSNRLRRSSVKDLFQIHLVRGELDRAAQLAEEWAEKEPLDPDALTARADVAASRGDRDLAIRILGSVVDVAPTEQKAQWRLARLYRWAGSPDLGCRFSTAVAQFRTRDAKLVAEAVRCNRATGDSDLARLLLDLAQPGERAAIEKIAGEPASDEVSGDFRLDATWSGGGADLDLVLIHPDGHRVSWLGAPTKEVISARDVLSRSHEALGLRGAAAGEYAVEIVRNGDPRSTVSGRVEIFIAGERREVPFTVEGSRTRIAVVKVWMKPELVPL